MPHHTQLPADLVSSPPHLLNLSVTPPPTSIYIYQARRQCCCQLPDADVARLVCPARVTPSSLIPHHAYMYDGLIMYATLVLNESRSGAMKGHETWGAMRHGEP